MNKLTSIKMINQTFFSVICISILLTLQNILGSISILFTIVLLAIYIGVIVSNYFSLMKINKVLRKMNFYVFIIMSSVFIISLIVIFVSLINIYGLEKLIESNVEYGKYIYFFVVFAQPIFTLIPEAVTIVTGSMVLGAWKGFIIGFLGTFLGVITMFFIVRIGGVKLIEKIGKTDKLYIYQKYTKKHTTLILFLLFMLPILPDEIVCIGAGLSSISYKKFILIAFLSKLITVYVYAFSIQLINYYNLISLEFVFIVGIIIILGVLFKRKNIINKI